MPAEEFHDRDLRGSTFRECDLSGVVMRAVLVTGMEIDAPWLLEQPGATLVVNGVDVAGFVDAELARRFPGRELRRADTPAELAAAWAALERTWTATLERVAGLPEAARDRQVAGEWSFAQTLRHLVLATDLWLGQAILRRDDPFHPLGLAHTGDGDGGVVPTQAEYDDVLAARAHRQAMVRKVIAGVTSEVLAEPRANPHDPAHEETVGDCLRVVIEEEWEHHRYAVRDLDAIESAGETASP